MDTEIHGYRYTWIQRYMDTEVHEYIDTWIQRYMDTEIHGYRGTWIQIYMVTDIHGYRGTWIQRYMDTEIHGYRDTWVQRYMDTEVHGYRGTWIQRYMDADNRGLKRIQSLETIIDTVIFRNTRIQAYWPLGTWIQGQRVHMYTAIQRYKGVAEISRDKGLTHIIILIRRYADKRHCQIKRFTAKGIHG